MYEIGKVYLPYLCTNVDAVINRKRFFEFKSDDIHISNARYSQYRVWCLKKLQDKYLSIPEEHKEDVKLMLKEFNCWEPLWRYTNLPMNNSQEERLPFWADRKMIGVNE